MDKDHMASPLVLAYGLGVDSTAVIVQWIRQSIRPGAILFADVGGEKPETYDYLPIINDYLTRHDYPQVTVVRNQVKDFKHWPPYEDLEQNCLTNGTLPSLAFGFKSCSIKWKQAPQHRWMKSWQPAIDVWAGGGQVVKAIGYDAGPKDMRRRHDYDNDEYRYIYPLIDWGWDRERCKHEIAQAGLPVPPKSSCFFCPAMKPDEVRALQKNYLRRIVVLEARAAPRLETIQGLWRNGCKGTRGAQKKPGRMTDFIRDEGLLPVDEIAQLTARVPIELVQAQQKFANGEDIPSWGEFFENLDAFASGDIQCGG
jgi:hypothetical protein